MPRLLTLGHAELIADSADDVASLALQPKRFGLLAVLAVDDGGRFHRRDSLLAMLWPECDEHHARAALRKALHHLRRALGESVIESRGLEEIRVDPVALWCDARVLVERAEEGDDAAAVALYAGEFLPGFHLPEAPEFDQWLDAHRQALRTTALECALRLVRQAREAATPELAVRWGRRATEIDPLSEPANGALIEGLAAVGDDGAAIHAYERYATLLERELDAAPGRELRGTVARLRQRPSEQAVPLAVAEMARPPATGPSLPRRFAWLATGLVLATGALGALWRRAEDAKPPGAPSAPVVAVLPLERVGGGTTEDYVLEGVQDALIADLAQNSSLRVVARGLADRYAASGRSAPVIARELSLRGVVRGTVERHGDSIDVHLVLVDGQARPLWASSYDTQLRELPVLAATAARVVSEELQVGETHPTRIARRSTPNAGAFEAWLEGSSHAARRTVADLEECVRLADEAAAIDPGYADAYDLLALCYTILPYVSDAPGKVMFERAKAAARRAIALDDSLASAHASLAYALAAGDWNWTGAEAEYRRAEQLDPRSAHVHGDFAFFLSWIGRHAEAMREARIAEQLDPVSPQTAVRVAVVYHIAGLNDTAIAEARRAIALDPAFMFGWERLAWAYLALGRTREAVAAMEQAARLAGPDDSHRRAFLAHAYARAGRRAEAQAILNALLDRRRKAYVSPIVIASVYVGLGDKQRAIEWLEHAYDEHDGLVLLRYFPEWAPLHGEPGYESLCRRLGL